jgi:hypothetical protein
MYGWWNTSKKLRTQAGLEGRQFCVDKGLTAESMGARMVELIDQLFESKPNVSQQYVLEKVESTTYENIGIV